MKKLLPLYRLERLKIERFVALYDKFLKHKVSKQLWELSF